MFPLFYCITPILGGLEKKSGSRISSLGLRAWDSGSRVKSLTLKACGSGFLALGVIELHWDNGKENGNYRGYRDYIGII